MPTMKYQRFFAFTAVSVGAGLIAAFLALQLLPEGDPAAPEQLPTVYRSKIPATGPASYSEAVSKAAPSVVNIFTTKITVQRSNPIFDDPIFQRFFGNRLSRPQKRLQTSLGSGVVISRDGYIITNHHVVNGADEIKVVLANGRTLHAEIAGSDPDTDVALLRTKEKDLPAITLGVSDNIQVGDVVLAIGNPFGVGQTVTMGIVSATGRSQLGINTFENFIQTDAAINPGNSGGALVNAAGELVGINTAIFSRSGGSHGIGFAIPVDLVEGVMSQILTKGRVVRGWFGIAGQDMTPELARAFGLKDVQGVLVSGVLENGPADQAGIKPGDIITRIGDQEPENSQDVLNIIATMTPNTQVKVEGWRGEERFKTEVTVSERPQQASATSPTPP
jgi:serine protease DegS